MVGFIERLFGKLGANNNLEGSSKVAKDRLQFVLVQDRVKIPADRVQAMKQEILMVISKYVDVDLDNVDFNISNRERNGLLVAEIPFISVTEDEDTPTDNPAEETKLPTESQALQEHDASSSPAKADPTPEENTSSEEED